MEKRLDNLLDVYSNTHALLKRLSTYNLYDLQATEGTLENFHRKLTSLKVNINSRKRRGERIVFI